MADAMDRLQEVAKLPKNWDSYGADAIWPDAVAVAARLIELFKHPPHVVPRSCGGIQLEWHMGGFDVEIAIPEQGGPITDDDVFFHDSRHTLSERRNDPGREGADD